jgi:hypothetical protein
MIVREKPMFRLFVLSLSLALPIAGAASVAAQTVELEPSRATIEEVDGAMQWQIENRTFSVVTAWLPGDDAPRSLLLAQSVVATQRSDRDGTIDPVVRVEASEISAFGALTPLWALETTAETGAARYLGGFGRVYVATLYGCCGAFDADRYFGIATGAPLVTANGPVALLEIPNSGGLARMAGVETPWSATRDLLFHERRDVIGVVGYAGSDRATQRVLLVLEGDLADRLESLMALPLVEWVPDKGEHDGEKGIDVTLWALDGERDPTKIGGVSLRIDFTPEAWVEIPVVADALDLAAARMAPGISLETLP